MNSLLGGGTDLADASHFIKRMLGQILLIYI